MCPRRYLKIIRWFYRAGHDGSLALLGSQNGVSFTPNAQHATVDAIC